jgi:hypothetical protein
MNFKDTAQIWICILMLLANRAAFGQLVGAPHNNTPGVAVPVGPIITILTAATGVLVRSQAASYATADLGRVSYFRGTSAPGQSSQKNSRALVISTRFALRVDCPGSSASSKVNVTMSRLDAADSHAITIDGTTVGSAAQTLTQSMPCGSGSEHRLNVEVPVSTPAGSMGSMVAFVATFNR